MRGISKAWAKLLAKLTPTMSEPSSPGPRVKATASISSLPMLAFLMAVSTTGTMFCWWAREASSGTTPPYCSCTFCEAMTLERMRSPRNTAAEVSSHDDSIASMVAICSVGSIECKICQCKDTLFFLYGMF